MLAKVKIDEQYENEMRTIHTCQTNGRFFKLMNARIKANVLHDASDPIADKKSRMLSTRSAAGMTDMVLSRRIYEMNNGLGGQGQWLTVTGKPGSIWFTVSCRGETDSKKDIVPLSDGSSQGNPQKCRA